MMLFFRNYFVFFSTTLLKSYVFCFYSSKKLKLSDHMCVCTHFIVMKWLISGDYSVVGSPMQWMLQSIHVLLYNC